VPAKFTSKTKWRAKLEKDQPVKLVATTPILAKKWGTGRLLIPRPVDVDAVMAKVRKGKLVTVGQIRQRLVADFNRLDLATRRSATVDGAVADSDGCMAGVACPLCTGIFVRIAAETAEEDRRAGRKRITPYWRVVRDDGSLHEKFPGGPAAQAAKLRKEGHRLETRRGKKQPRVVEFEKRLAKLL
jgi:hypothetical protein